MRKSFYRTDYLFSKTSFFVGMGSVLSLFSPFYSFNDSSSVAKADRTAIESDFAVIWGDIEKIASTYDK